VGVVLLLVPLQLLRGAVLRCNAFRAATAGATTHAASSFDDPPSPPSPPPKKTHTPPRKVAATLARGDDAVDPWPRTASLSVSRVADLGLGGTGSAALREESFLVALQQQIARVRLGGVSLGGVLVRLRMNGRVY